jgi:hypothetical protein
MSAQLSVTDMNATRTLRAFAIAGVALAMAMTGAWYQAHLAFLRSRSQFVAATLEPVAAQLKENQAIIDELQAEPYAEKDSGILESYLIKIRRDGVAKNAQMKQRLDELSENNTAIVALIATYLPDAKTAAFASESNRFRNYAAAWRDRWDSVMELFMAGGNYPAAVVPFPKNFPGAVQAEIAVAR